MLTKTQGVVFHAFKYGESSLITEVYTRDFGLRRYIASGVRSKKPRFSAGLFQVMTPLELVVYHREDKDLNRLKEVQAAWILEHIPFDIRRGAIAMFLAEVSRKSIREAVPHAALYDFLLRTIHHLDRAGHPPVNLPIYFLLRLSAFLGFQPAGDCTPETPYFHLQEGAFLPGPAATEREGMGRSLSKTFYRMLCLDWAAMKTVHLEAGEARLLLSRLLDYFRLHLPNFPELRSPDILRQVFAK